MAIVAGPTASGKSALALAIGDRIPVTVVNADASQVYRDLRIVSARPDPADTARAPHVLFGHVDGAEDYNAARWAAAARDAIGESHAAGRMPVIVGGTGLYLRTLIDGIAPVPPIDPAVRDAVRALPVATAHAALSAEDPLAAARLAPADTSRVARALEVVRSSGRTIDAWHAERSGGIGESVDVAATILLPPRDWLFDRCDSRFAAILEQGGVAEVRALVARDLSPALPVMRAIGVRDIAALIAGAIDAAAATAQAQRATRRYAKRQYTWFRNQPPADWHRIDGVPDIAALADDLAARLRD